MDIMTAIAVRELGEIVRELIVSLTLRVGIFYVYLTRHGRALFIHAHALIDISLSAIYVNARTIEWKINV